MLALAIAAALANQSATPAPPVPTVIYGVGLRPCSDWTRETRAPSSQEQWIFKGWIGGFFSGLQLLNNAEGRPDFMKDMNMEKVFVRIDAYCAANPTVKIGHAASVLSAELFGAVLSERR
jgi:hypothetical protein